MSGAYKFIILCLCDEFFSLLVSSGLLYVLSILFSILHHQAPGKLLTADWKLLFTQ